MNIMKHIKQILTAKTISVTDRLLTEQDKLNLARDEIKSKYEKLAYESLIRNRFISFCIYKN